MAKVTTIFILIAFLVALCHAQSLNKPENDAIVSDHSVVLLESKPDPKTTTETILLPTDEPESGSESETLPEIGLDAAGSLHPQPETISEEKPETETGENSIPLTFVSFHPINRRFPRRPFSYLHPKRPCCHHHHRGHRMFNPWAPRLEIHYGRDMVQTDLGFDPVFHGGAGGMRDARWMRLRPGEVMLPVGHHVGESNEARKISHRHRHRHHHDHEDEEEVHKEKYDENDDVQDEREEEKKSGLVKTIRKFLKHHF